MAIVDVSEPIKFRKQLIGLSTDVKPTGTQYIGAFFTESDTGFVFTTADGTTWFKLVI
jgi:hypothetical protein